MVPQSSIVCYYDIVSPYSYVAVKLLNRYRTQWKDVDIVLRPVFLPGILSGSKNSPPATVAAKLPYMTADLVRVSTCAGIPYAFPSQFPVLTVSTMRLLVAIQKYESDEIYVQCVEKLYEAYWSLDKDVSQKSVLIATLAPILRSEAKAEEYYLMTSDKTIKQGLIDNTNQALEAGAFGAPTFVVKKAGSEEMYMFFGSDRFELISFVLGLSYPGLAPKNASKL